MVLLPPSGAPAVTEHKLKAVVSPLPQLMVPEKSLVGAAVLASVKAIESCTRVQDLSWKHHQEVAGREDAPALLAWAVENQASVKDLRAEKKRRQKGEALSVKVSVRPVAVVYSPLALSVPVVRGASGAERPASEP